MLICKDEKAYNCGKIKSFTIGEKHCMHFSVLESVSPIDVANLFSDDFYFYDDVLNGRLPDTNNTKLVGLCITYNADSTCKIKIILLKGADSNDEG